MNQEKPVTIDNSMPRIYVFKTFTKLEKGSFWDSISCITIAGMPGL